MRLSKPILSWNEIPEIYKLDAMEEYKQHRINQCYIGSQQKEKFRIVFADGKQVTNPTEVTQILQYLQPNQLEVFEYSNDEYVIGLN